MNGKEIKDTRPDTLLKEMREHGDWAKACEKSQMLSAEVETLCQDDPEFDLNLVESQLACMENELTQVTEAAIEQARQNLQEKIDTLRGYALAQYRGRHSSTVTLN